MTRRTADAWCTAAVILLLAAGCAKAGSTGTPVTGGGAVGVRGASATPKVGVPASPPKPVWFQLLQMTSVTSGWALVWSANPGVIAENAHILLARTTDGARTWSDVTPAAARPLLATLHSYEALDAVDGDHAYLAVSHARSDDGDPVSTTAVFGTADGGRTWAESAVFTTSAPVARVSFADASYGWLLLGQVFEARASRDLALPDIRRRPALVPGCHRRAAGKLRDEQLLPATEPDLADRDHGLGLYQLPGAGRVPCQP